MKIMGSFGPRGSFFFWGVMGFKSSATEALLKVPHVVFVFGFPNLFVHVLIVGAVGIDSVGIFLLLLSSTLGLLLGALFCTSFWFSRATWLFG